MRPKAVLGLLAVAVVAVAMVPPSPAAASWPGSNGSIFAVAQDGNQRTVARFSPSGQPSGSAGSGVTEFSNIATSADGSQLAYSKNGDIVVVDLESFEETPVVQGPGTESDPAFSFDGRYLAYVSGADGDGDVYMIELGVPQATPVNLTNNSVDDWSPAFGNDGTGHGALIAYVSLQNGPDSDIFTMTPGGTDKRDLTSNDVHDFGPNWHPSFDRLAYSSQDAEGRDQIFTMAHDGTNKAQLTSDDSYNYEPAWSPDGTKIAFTKQGTVVGSLGRIFVRSASPGGTATAVTPTGSTGYDRAEWQAIPCEQDCGPNEVTPVLFMNLRRHLVVSGGVDGVGTTTGGTCGVGTPIKIQRFVEGRFRTIASVTTDASGTFRKRVPDRTGRYRLISSRYTDEADGTTCLAARSASKTHRHT